MYEAEIKVDERLWKYHTVIVKVEANSLEEAIEKSKNHEWMDSYWHKVSEDTDEFFVSEVETIRKLEDNNEV